MRPIVRRSLAQQLLAEAEDLDAQVVPLHVLDREPGVAGEPRRDLVEPLAIERVAAEQRERVVAGRKRLDLVEELAQRPLQVRLGELAVMPGRGRVGREEQGVRKVVAALERPGLRSKPAVWKLRIDEISSNPLKAIPWRL